MLGKNITVGNLVATLKTFLSTYFGKEVETKITPFYFPFTEPSFEFSLSCPFVKKAKIAVFVARSVGLNFLVAA
ncbi:hypothetical protein H6801_00615 [Candidatus Nomurabacteria bacterium]|nr:hypothetical protein [Candidatus Nomurabacteria bacterium]